MNYLKIFFIVIISFFIVSCSDDSNDSTSSTINNNNTQKLTADIFISQAIQKFIGWDFSYQNPDGLTDSDGDGKTDVNDAVIIIHTLRDHGYPDLKPTTISGIYNNFYTDLGFAYEDGVEYNSKTDYNYTKPSSVKDTDLQNMSWNLLEKGDLIFLDYDTDNIWDNAAIYIGKYENFQNAAFFSSDHYDKVVIEDLDDSNSIINIDIANGFSDVKKLVLIQP
jgi:hypothetical protein